MKTVTKDERLADIAIRLINIEHQNTRILELLKRQVKSEDCDKEDNEPCEGY